MPDYRCPNSPTGPVFFTLCLAERGGTALLDHIDALRAAVSETKRDLPFEILAFVVLPDHLHAIWDMPAADRNYSQRWGRIKSHFSQNVCRAGPVPPVAKDAGMGPAKRHWELGIWQSRFREHHIRNDRDLQIHLEYCWADPVRHGFVEAPTDWDASSIHRDIRQGRVEPGWFDAGPVRAFGEAGGMNLPAPGRSPAISGRIS